MLRKMLSGESASRRVRRPWLLLWSGQAENVWSMLDDMAANDPQGYQSFIQAQFETAKKSAGQ
jgi:hypothetical protein